MVASWQHRAWVLAAALAASAGCSVGQGQAEITADVLVQDTDLCEIDEPAMDLAPTFFAAEVTDDQINIRVQRGSQVESDSDGFSILVRDVNEIKRQRIGLPITVDPLETGLVQMIFYFNGSCPSGFPETATDEMPVNMEGVSGTITFRSIYAPEIDPGSTGIEAELTDVRFEDRDAPELRNATLNGWFQFFYQRGAPAQRFP